MYVNPTPAFLKQLDQLRALKLPSDEYAVHGSGPLALRGLREANDIDLIVKRSLWERLCTQYDLQKPGLLRLADGIEAFHDWELNPASADELIDSADEYAGIRFVKLEYVRAWKQRRRSEKDLRDLELIEQFCRSGGKSSG